jgi:hypothetical protein
METLAEVLRVTSDDLGAPDYVVVYGSRACEIGQSAESDVDVCFEATWIPEEPGRMLRMREHQNEFVFDLMTFPRGLLLGRLRVHDDVALAIAREGRVYPDADGW